MTEFIRFEMPKGEQKSDPIGLRDFLRKPRSALQLQMDAIIPSHPEQVHESWTYYDIPGTVTRAQWNAFADVVGEDEVFVLAYTIRQWDGRVRGQFFISPKGMKRLTEFLALDS